mmetsp:Transcript_26255/g.81097  ORF Transcript_26255/g.81097 Transcript_26255/m.81097 type:complete len:280 (-) Transcript_26255:124-963(-)
MSKTPCRSSTSSGMNSGSSTSAVASSQCAALTNSGASTGTSSLVADGAADGISASMTNPAACVTTACWYCRRYSTFSARYCAWRACDSRRSLTKWSSMARSLRAIITGSSLSSMYVGSRASSSGVSLIGSPISTFSFSLGIGIKVPVCKLMRRCTFSPVSLSRTVTSFTSHGSLVDGSTSFKNDTLMACSRWMICSGRDSLAGMVIGCTLTFCTKAWFLYLITFRIVPRWPVKSPATTSTVSPGYHTHGEISYPGSIQSNMLPMLFFCRSVCLRWIQLL